MTLWSMGIVWHMWHYWSKGGYYTNPLFIILYRGYEEKISPLSFFTYLPPQNSQIQNFSLFPSFILKIKMKTLISSPLNPPLNLNLNLNLNLSLSLSRQGWAARSAQAAGEVRRRARRAGGARLRPRRCGGVSAACLQQAAAVAAAGSCCCCCSSGSSLLPLPIWAARRRRGGNAAARRATMGGTAGVRRWGKFFGICSSLCLVKILKILEF